MHYFKLRSEDLKHLKGKFLQVIPQIHKTVPCDIHMSYFGVDENIPDRDAQTLMKTLKHKFPNFNIPFFNGLDIGGQINPSSRQGIESVAYFKNQPNLNNLIGCISEIIQSDVKLSTILDCNPRRNICQQLCFDNTLGLAQQDIVASINSKEIQVVYFKFGESWFTKDKDISTSSFCRISINHKEGVIVPQNYTVPSFSGQSRVITVKRMYEYTAHRDQPATASPDLHPSSKPNGHAAVAIHGKLASTIQDRILQQW